MNTSFANTHESLSEGDSLDDQASASVPTTSGEDQPVVCSNDSEADGLPERTDSAPVAWVIVG